MAKPAIQNKNFIYQDIIDLPENKTGELIQGQLYVHPRPTFPHALALSNLGIQVGSAYHFGKGGPGGWWIIDEPEIHFIRDTEVVVPDIAGWRKARMPQPPKDHRIEVVPDWICEVLSPSTAKSDRIIKMPLYAKYGVAYLWLIDPLLKTLEAYTLNENQWQLIGAAKDNEKVCFAPFDALELALEDLWS